MDDAALVRAACEGDKQAFADIYDRYSDRIFSFLCTVVRNREDAADLLQDTFLTAAARLHQLRDPDKLRPWLYAVARHLAMKNLKRTGRQDPLDEDFQLADPAAGPTELAAKSELALLIQAAAEGLGAQDRVVLDLHLRQGLEGQELAEALGVNPGHAYVMLSRMRDQVERSLGALMVARQGSKDCRRLEALLKPWDGRLSATWRKRVARHVDGCAICSDLRKRMVSPAAMLGLGAIPLIAAPAFARESVLEKLQLVGSASDPGSASDFTSIAAGQGYADERWPARLDGFPPPMAPRRRRLVTVASAVLVLLLMAAVPTAALVRDPEPQVVAEPPKTYPLVFNDEVLKTPSPSPTPEPAFVTSPQPNGVAPTLKPVTTPRPSPAPSFSPRPTQSPASRPSPSPSPSVRPTPPAGTPGTPGRFSDPGRDGTPGESPSPASSPSPTRSPR